MDASDFHDQLLAMGFTQSTARPGELVKRCGVITLSVYKQWGQPVKISADANIAADMVLDDPADIANEDIPNQLRDALINILNEATL